MEECKKVLTWEQKIQNIESGTSITIYIIYIYNSPFTLICSFLLKRL